MPRLKMPTRESLNDEQRAVYDQAASGPRGHAPTPFAAWLRSPQLAHNAEPLGAFIRFKTSVPERYSRIAVLVVGRRWSSSYIWYTQKKAALAIGIDPVAIEDIRNNKRPTFKDPTDQLVYDFFAHLQDEKRVPDELYAAALKTFGEKTLVELVAIQGYYTFVAVTLKTFEIGTAEGIEPEV